MESRKDEVTRLGNCNVGLMVRLGGGKTKFKIDNIPYKTTIPLFHRSGINQKLLERLS